MTQSPDTQLQELVNRLNRLENVLKVRTETTQFYSPEKLEASGANKDANGALVYPELVTWLVNDDEKKIHNWTKVRAATNEVRQLLFERQRKAETKESYGGGLKLDEGPDGITHAAVKLADALFFMFKHVREQRPMTRTQKVNMEKGTQVVKDLLLLINNLLKS